MSRAAEPVSVAAGLRSSVRRGVGALAEYDAVPLSVPVSLIRVTTRRTRLAKRSERQ